MSHILGVYYAPGHNRYEDQEYIRALQPPAVRVLDPDVAQLALVHRLAPNALLLPRDWALSEQHDDVRRDPAGTGVRHAQDWRGKIDRWRSTGAQLPGDDRIVVVGINEPRVWDSAVVPWTVEYNVAFLDECTRLGLRACALNLSVGWPGNTGPDTPPDWSPYAPVLPAIKRGNHYLCVHEYWYRTGPQDGAGWWAWRIRHNTWDVPIIIGETGVDNYVDNDRWNNEGKPPRGWGGNVAPATYADQVTRYARGLDKRVVAILPFLTDYRSREWASFDTAGAAGELLASASQMVPQATVHTIHIPAVIAPPAPDPTGEPPAPQPPADNWAEFMRCYDFTRRWEGGWADHPADKGGATMRGITLATFVRWRHAQGMGTPTKDDLRNIRDDEVEAIYYQWYWLPSGAATLPYPANLVRFDTAVLFGVDVALWYAQEAGASEYALLGLRLLGHAGSVEDDPSQVAFWDGWRGRVMQLRSIVRKARGWS